MDVTYGCWGRWQFGDVDIGEYGVGPPVRREKKKKEGEHRSRGDQKIPERCPLKDRQTT